MTPPTESSAPEPTNTVPAISAKGLVKTFTGRSGTVEAVRGVDLTVQPGEVFGFLGPNGAGKSTTVRMLTTLTGITGGSATVAGVDVASDPDGVRHKIGVALQEAGLDMRQTGRELRGAAGQALRPLARRGWRARRKSCSSWSSSPKRPTG